MQEMGVARQSLYDTFGDKRALYLKAMAYYRDQTNGQMQRMLEQIPSVKDGFAKLLYGFAAETREQHERGCLLLSANLQRDTSDREIADLLRDNQEQVKAIFFTGIAARTKTERTSPQAGSKSARALFRGHHPRDARHGPAQVRQEGFRGSCASCSCRFWLNDVSP